MQKSQSKRFTSLILAFLMVCGLVGMPNAKLTVKAEGLDITSAFKDANFLAEVRKLVIKPTGPIFDTDVVGRPELRVENKDIKDLSGIEYFTSLEYLYCWNNQITRLDVSNNTLLTYLYCAENNLSELDLSNNATLIEIICNYNQLTKLDLSNNATLKYLSCNNNQLTELDVSNNTVLTFLSCGGNQLTELDVSNNTALEYLYCGHNQLTELNVSDNTALRTLSCNNNQFTEIDVSGNINLTWIDCFDNRLTKLDVSNNTALTYLDCSYNNMESPDDVIGWETTGLTLYIDFEFYPQNPSPQCGDLNGDQNVDIQDLVILAQHIAEIKLLKGSYLKGADINGDGKVNIADLILFSRYLAGYDDNTQIGKPKL